MTDYGHDLLFGTFITPIAQPPQHAVELSVVADRAGLDLVTFQDHPYQPAFLDTWTLLSYVASRTKQIHVSANVLNLPLRQPAVIARSAASLDLLSGGRFELGIGAGAFWDAIEAMGGRRLTRWKKQSRSSAKSGQPTNVEACASRATITRSMGPNGVLRQHTTLASGSVHTSQRC